MRFSEWVIVALMLFLPFAIGQEIEQDRQAAAVVWRQNMDRIIDRACEDAVLSLLSADGNAQATLTDGMWATGADGVELNLDAAWTRFRDTVYMGFGADTGTQVSRDALDFLMPVQLVVAEDRLFVHAVSEVRDEITGISRFVRLWKPGIPYAWYDAANRLVIQFTLSDIAWVYDENTGIWQTGNRLELAELYPASLFASPAAFQTQRRQVITDLVRNTLTSELAHAGAGSIGEGVPVFNIPYESGEGWYNAIDGISFIGFLTGMNIPGTREVYTTSGLGGGRLAISAGYPVTSVAGDQWVHRPSCLLAASALETYPTERDAAMAGYASCPHCRP